MAHRRSQRSLAKVTAAAAITVAAAVVVTACTGSHATSSATAATSVSLSGSVSRVGSTPTAGSASTTTTSPGTTSPATNSSAPGSTEPAGRLTISFAGDVHFAERTATLLAADPATAFGSTAAVLSKADLTMVNLETAIDVGGQPQDKSFTFAAPPSALTALADAGIDVATMANNHGVDFGAAGLTQTLAAIRASGFPVIGIGANAQAAFTPFVRTVNGVRLAIIAATAVHDETLANFSATTDSGGVANAFSPRLVAAVRAARAQGETVIVYLHWGTEYQQCPNGDQVSLANELAAAGATAVVGTHAHVLQGAGWRTDGTYVAYGLGNYFWWRSFGNDQDDNGVLTLTVAPGQVLAADFNPSHLSATGISPPATGAQRARILAEWATARGCTGLSATPVTTGR